MLWELQALTGHSFLFDKDACKRLGLAQRKAQSTWNMGWMRASSSWLMFVDDGYNLRMDLERLQDLGPSWLLDYFFSGRAHLRRACLELEKVPPRINMASCWCWSSPVSKCACAQATSIFNKSRIWSCPSSSLLISFKGDIRVLQQVIRGGSQLYNCL